MTEKSETALKTIGEAAQTLDIPSYVIRFWETKFKELQIVKRNNIRYYTPDDINLLHIIKELLYKKGFTIKGAQKYLKDIKKEKNLFIDDTKENENNYDLKEIIKNTIDDLKSLKNYLTKK